MLDPRLRGKPIGIRQKYLLVTCNYTARRLGARKMESVVEARREDSRVLCSLGTITITYCRCHGSSKCIWCTTLSMGWFKSLPGAISKMCSFMGPSGGDCSTATFAKIAFKTTNLLSQHYVRRPGVDHHLRVAGAGQTPSSDLLS